MAKLKLPFELEKPSSNEYVTQASQIGYGNSNVEEELLQQNKKVEKSATVRDSDSNANLDISDADGNVISRFAGGDFQTKNFNSANIKVEKVNGKNILYLGK